MLYPAELRERGGVLTGGWGPQGTETDVKTGGTGDSPVLRCGSRSTYTVEPKVKTSDKEYREVRAVLPC